MTLRYEKRERPVTMSSDKPSAKALRSAFAPTYLNGKTATQNPSSRRAEASDASLLNPEIFAAPRQFPSHTKRELPDCFGTPVRRHRRLVSARPCLQLRLGGIASSREQSASIFESARSAR